MTGKNKLKKITEEYGGIITTKVAEENNIHREYLGLLVKEGELDRVSYGVYASADAWEDALFINQLKRDKMIYSHETALFLHDLTDRDPINYVVTVPRGYNPSRLKKVGLIVHTVKKEWFELGVCTKRTTFGNEVRTYDMERTICDILRDRNNQDPAVVSDALKRYFVSKEKDLNKLMKYASELKIETILRTYSEVLL
ncbi:MAG: abortive phage infection protein [Syntrophomonadaceae bacterium]|jgi:predicted transcriptional regulator of viral defense system|nr:abortive phage infection protein [Syntrophomonadaceae bacterium]